MPSATLSSTRSSKRCSPSVRAGHIFARLTLVASAISFIAAILTAQFSAHALTAPLLNNLNNASIPAWGAGAQKSIGAIVGSVILTVLGLLGVIFVILLTYAGFLWLSAAGEEDKVKKAQGLIVNSIIGVLIVVASYTIAYFVLRKLGAAF